MVGSDWHGVVRRDLVRPTWLYVWAVKGTTALMVQPPSSVVELFRFLAAVYRRDPCSSSTGRLANIEVT